METATLTHDIRPGDFLVYRLVTDTTGYYVTKVTERSIWLVPAHRTSITKSKSNGSPFPTVYKAIEAPVDIKEHEAKRYGIRKDGTFRIAGWANPLHKAPVTDFGVEGERPYVETDYSF